MPNCTETHKMNVVVMAIDLKVMHPLLTHVVGIGCIQ